MGTCLVTKNPSFAAGLATATLLALALAGCGGPEGGSADDVTLTIEDLRGLIEEGDGLSTLEFDASEVITNAADDSESISGFWEESGGEPAECFAAFSTSYLLDGSEDGAGGDDDTMELGVFTEPGDDDFGLVIVNGRIFDSADAAAGFLGHVAESTGDCADGYTLSDHGDVRWETAGFEGGTFAAAPDGIATATNEEVVITEGAGLRTTFLQRGNAVISFYSETYEGGTFTLDDVDPVITAVAGRLAEIPA